MIRRLAARWTRRPDGPSDGARQHVFIVTYARSGSTLLQKILASLPDAHICGENNDALAGLWASCRSAHLTRTEQGGTRRVPPGDPWRGAHRIDPSRYGARLAQVFLDEILQAPSGARIVGFKEVRYFDHEEDLEPYLDWIRETFRHALLVFNRRNAEAVARSSWWKDHPGDIAADVRRFDARAEAYAALHPAETLVVDYEAYTADPAHLRPLLHRLGVPFDDGAVRAIMQERLRH